MPLKQQRGHQLKKKKGETIEKIAEFRRANNSSMAISLESTVGLY